ncbi:hypothetical protein ABBQ32_001542 [Trebouxia sp. C0010 RCD-2024]
MSSSDIYLSWLESAQAKNPKYASQLSQLGEYYKQKLWHQLTTLVEELLPEAEFQSFLISFYDNFIIAFAHRINLLKLAQIAEVTAKQYKQPEQAIQFLVGVNKQITESGQRHTEQPMLFLRMHIAEYKLQMGSIDECKTLIEEGKETLDSMQNVDPAVSAVVHYVRSLYYKYEKSFAEFYKSSLLYLAFISSDKLPQEQKLALAVDISLAALLGENIYNFGELLQHPIIEVLDSVKDNRWLKEMLECFHAGDLHRYDELCTKHKSVLNNQPALTENVHQLRQKITILCLMELIFSLPAQERTISLDTIGQKTKLEVDGVEFLLMKTLSLHLIEGVVDQVDGNVKVSWVQPRVLTNPQISALKDRLDGWIGKVTSASLVLEEGSLDVMVA